MSKKISYYLEFDGFLQLAQKALDLGCSIVCEDKKAGVLTQRHDIGIITQNRGIFWYFYLPEAGDLNAASYDGKERLNGIFNPSANVVLEARGSRINTEQKEIFRGELYLSTGYYDEDKNFITPPDCLVKLYNALAQYVKKLAPYTEVTEGHVYVGGPKDGQKEVRMVKKYISPYCFDLKENKGYKLRG